MHTVADGRVTLYKDFYGETCCDWPGLPLARVEPPGPQPLHGSIVVGHEFLQ